MATLSPDDLAEMLMQVAHAIDMINHLPDPGSWTDEQLDKFPISVDELRLLKHAANESWAINARLLAQFFLGDKHGLDAKTFLESWQSSGSDLAEWRTTASEHLAHFSPRRLSDPVRTLTPGERLDVALAVNAEANRFARELETNVGTEDLGRAMAGYLADVGLRRSLES
ncbi:MAG TPA: hypothetical protein PKD80_11215 [Microthrixaceae bacterium]|jgi:hypothetical protein|nr:hypothetical protein [Microthrixaceae bacterium]HMT25565.1 hypothetical protein [Microthrixaceae bacterium]HMT61272.1 hypothetical protein [Microthrixaceae bacterium]